MPQALFSAAHDAIVSTTLKDGRPVTYRVSEHKVGAIFDAEGNTLDLREADLEHAVSTPIECECPTVELTATPEHVQYDDTPSTDAS